MIQILFFITIVVLAITFGAKNYSYYYILLLSLLKDPILLYAKGHKNEGSIELMKASFFIYILQVIVLSTFYYIGKAFY